MGLTFPNPVGLAAGWIKMATILMVWRHWALALSRLAPSRRARSRAIPSRGCSGCRPATAIINRMGFNNLGVDHLVGQVEKMRYKGILGINIGKNLIPG
jgi:dihydroorotate dehydrogenase